MAVSNNNISNSDTGKQVRDRLLDAAENLFSENGFEGTSIREITSEAKCNVAAVNYHFGGKDKLYLEVFNRHFITLCDVRIAEINRVMSESDGNVILEELLSAFATAFIEPLMGKSSGRRFMKLMTREMLDPHIPRNMFLEKMIMPTLTAMQNALVKTCPGLEESKIPLLVFSIVGQLIHAVRVKAMFEQADGTNLPVFDLAEVVDHIVAFSAAGIRAAAEGKANAQNSAD